MPNCPDGCLCDDCCKQARAFGYGHWNLQEFDDQATVVSHSSVWRPLEDGSTRRAHPKAA